MAQPTDASPAAAGAEASSRASGAIPVTPAPWVLTGRGLVVLLHARRPVPGRGVLGRISAVAFVDYESSDVGPYRELLHVPYVTRWEEAVGPTVDHIWVTLAESAVSGNANWGLTKTVADIERTPLAGGAERWTASDEGGDLGQVTHRPFGPPLPVGKPKNLGRLLQVRHGQRFATPVGVRGLVRASRVQDASFDAGRLLDLGAHRIVGAAAITAGTMTFNQPRITDLP